MCLHTSWKIAKDAILIFKREATQNACATVDGVVALSRVSPSVRWTVHSLFVCFRHVVETKFRVAEKSRISRVTLTTTFLKKILLIGLTFFILCT